MNIPFISKAIGKVADGATEGIKTLSNKEQASRRQGTDMLSDSWLSKNIRPMVAIWVVLLFTAFLIAQLFGVDIDTQTSQTLFWLLMVTVGFYFPSRTFEKWVKNSTGNK